MIRAARAFARDLRTLLDALPVLLVDKLDRFAADLRRFNERL